MLARALRENIPKLARARDLSYPQLEELAGLHKNYISNFLANDGIPRVDVVVKLADTLKVSVDDLLGRASSETTKDFSLPSDDTELELKLMENCVSTIAQLLREKDQEISFNKFLYLAKEIYLYCLCRNEKKVDIRFSSWFIDRALE